MIIVNKKITSFTYRRIRLKGGKPVPVDLIETAKNHKINGKTMYDLLIESKQWVDDTPVIKPTVKKEVKK